MGAWLGGFVGAHGLRVSFHARLEPARALAATASQTAGLTGIDTGVGLYLNYTFAVVWLADATWLHLAKHSHESRPAWLGALMHGFVAFMWFNATVVFGSPWGQSAGWAAIVGLSSWFALQHRQAL